MIATNGPLVDRSQLTLPGWRVSDDLAARFSELNDDIESLLARNREFEESEIDTGADAADISLAAIRERRDELQDCKLKILQTLVELFRRRVELIEAAKVELTESAAKAEKDLAALKSKVAKQLEKAGSGLETMVAWPTNAKSAEIQFNHVVARNVSVKAAAEELANLTANLNATRSQCRETEGNLEFARRKLDSLVSELVSS